MNSAKCVYICLIFLSMAGYSQKIDLKLTNKITINRDSDYVYAYTMPEASTFKANENVWYHWYGGGSIKATRGGYGGKLLNGKYICFYNNKNLEEKGFFKRGIKSGRWVSWHPNGEMRSVSHWRRGKQVRSSYHYDDSHNLEKVIRHRNGKEKIKYPQSPKVGKKKQPADTLQKPNTKNKRVKVKSNTTKPPKSKEDTKPAKALGKNKEKRTKQKKTKAKKSEEPTDKPNSQEKLPK